MKKILFATYTLLTLFIICLFSYSTYTSEEKKELRRIGNENHYVILDTTYDATIISESSLIANHTSIFPIYFSDSTFYYRTSKNLEKKYATAKNDSLLLSVYSHGMTGASVDIIITKNDIKSSARLFDCTYNYEVV
ncbi:hypothetical protein [Bernardetia sp.]|uniref:hypothetical protein n=1 Tax=Bernardetia sp. TaxID=1937974 RepID=UPI0025BF167D|nr:hypothetical protein [Bernardetia sp.]